MVRKLHFNDEISVRREECKIPNNNNNNQKDNRNCIKKKGLGLNTNIHLGGEDPNQEVGNLRVKNEISPPLKKGKKKSNNCLLKKKGAVTLRRKGN